MYVCVGHSAGFGGHIWGGLIIALQQDLKKKKKKKREREEEKRHGSQTDKTKTIGWQSVLAPAKLLTATHILWINITDIFKLSDPLNWKWH